MAQTNLQLTLAYKARDLAVAAGIAPSSPRTLVGVNLDRTTHSARWANDADMFRGYGLSTAVAELTAAFA